MIFSYYLSATQMLPLLAVFLILCLVGMSDKGWAKTLPPKMQNNYVVANFHFAILSVVSCPFRENERLEREIKVYLGYYSVFY